MTGSSTIALPPSSGARPVFGPDNHLGTTVFGGQGNDGTVFTLTLKCRFVNIKLLLDGEVAVSIPGGSDGSLAMATLYGTQAISTELHGWRNREYRYRLRDDQSRK